VVVEMGGGSVTDMAKAIASGDVAVSIGGTDGRAA
jgi:alcohol dehydrogenase class IV